MIEIKKLNKNYNDKIIFKNLSIKFDVGLNMIYGPTGTGKSTLLNMIHMTINDYSGDILIDEKRLKSMNDKEQSFYRNQKIGYVFQDYKLFNNLNVKDNILIPTYLYKNNVSLDEIVLKMNIKNLLNKNINKLSGGEKQKVSIARAIINNPVILLADEPTSSLDSKSEKEIMKIIKKLSKNRIVIMVTHNELLKKYADHIFILEKYGLKEYE